MANSIKIYCDLTNRILVASSKGINEVTKFPSPFHVDELYMSIQPLIQSPDGLVTSQPYSVPDGSGYSLSVALFDVTGATTLAGIASTWTPDGTAKLGSLDLNTAAMATAFTSGGTTQITALLYFQFNDGNGVTTLFKQITVLRSYLNSGTPSAVAGVRYLTDADEARYVKYSGNTAPIELVCATDATKKNLLYTDTDGQFQASPEA